MSFLTPKHPRPGDHFVQSMPPRPLITLLDRLLVAACFLAVIVIVLVKAGAI